MTTRQDYIYQLTGRITDKRLKKKKDGSPFYQLGVIITNKEQIKKINVFQDGLEKEEIWTEIEETNYLDKRYLFYCKNFMGTYYLVNWKELPPLKETQELAEYEEYEKK